MNEAELAFAGVARQAELIRSREVSSLELVELYLERIARIDPQLNAYRSVYAERARTEAQQAQARLDGGDERPLLGVPVAIKDNTDVAGDITANGSNSFGEAAREDAEVVRRVRSAGAIVIGKTHVPELCMFPFCESAAWGITRNPWDRQRAPGGSSGGSAAAVAAGLVGAALGSDGAGSIRIPSAWCGIFGLKPQRDRISLAPLREHWHGLSVLGWLTRRVSDTALLHDVTGPLPAAAGGDAPRLRIAVSFKPPPGLIAPLDGEIRQAVEETAEQLRSLGHEVRERDPDYGTFAANGVARYLRGIHDDAVSVPHPDRLERRTRGMSRLGAMVTPGLMARVRADEAGQIARVNRVFDDHDVLLTPVTARPPVDVGRWEGRGALWTFNGVAAVCPYTITWNATGQPGAAVPAGFSREGAPLAAQLVGRPHDEATLLGLAAQLEDARQWPDQRPELP